MLQKYAEAGQVGTLDVLDAVSLPKNAGHRRLARARRYAHRHHFAFAPRRGYIYVRSRAISSRCNDNFDEFPAAEIKKGYRTFIGKPVYVNHHNADIRRARGVIIDAALHEDTNPDGTEDTWAEVLMEVDAIRFPVLAREVLAGNIARTSMGTDVEYSVCTACGNKAYTPADYCQHIPKMKGMKIRRVNAATGRNEEVLIAERCYGLGFFENSLLVEDPADPTAFVLGVDDGNSLSTAAAKAVIDEAEDVVREAFRYDTNHNSYDKPYAGTRPKQQDKSAPGSRTFEVGPGNGLGSEQHIREQQQRSERETERRNRQIQHEHPESAEMLRNIEERRKERSQQRKGPRAASRTASRRTAGANHRHASPLSDDWTGGWAAPTKGRVFDWGHRITPSRDIVRLYEGPEGHARFYDEFARQQGPDFPDIDDAFRWAEQIGWADPENSDMGDWGYAASRRTAYGTHRCDHCGEGNEEWQSECGACGRCMECGQALPTGSTPQETYDLRLPHRKTHDPFIASLRSTAYGETKAPPKVDTMRAESCPVCGDDEGYNGDKCSVCGYATPPSQFRDPDLTKAREMDLRQDQADEQGLPGQEIPGEDQQPEDLQCDQCGETFSAEGDATTDSEPTAEEAQAPEEADPEHPDDTEDGDRPEADEPDDLSDLADKSDEELLGEDEEDEEWVDDEEEVSDQDPATGEGRITGEPEPDLDENGLEQPEVAAGDTCPVCGEGTLVQQKQTSPDDEPELTEVGEDPTKANKVTSARSRVPAGVSTAALPPYPPMMSKETVDMNDRQPQRRQASPTNKAQQHRSRLIAAIREQQATIERQDAQIGHLTRSVASLAIAAGVESHPHFASIVRQSGLRRRADSDTNNSPSGAPATSTEEAKKPDATDDPTNVGAAPSPANTGVTPEGVTDVNNSDVTVNPPVLDNLQDPTKPTGGTDSPTPAAGDAQGATDITVGNPSNESFDKPGDSGWKSTTSAKGSEVERFSSSLRLARLQIAAGIEPSTAEDLAVAQKIASTEQTLSEIDVQAATLEKVTSTQRQASQDPAARRLVPRRAASQGQGVVPARNQPSLQQTAGSATPEGREGEDQWLVGDPTA